MSRARARVAPRVAQAAGSARGEAGTGSGQAAAPAGTGSGAGDWAAWRPSWHGRAELLPLQAAVPIMLMSTGSAQEPGIAKSES